MILIITQDSKAETNKVVQGTDCFNQHIERRVLWYNAQKGDKQQQNDKQTICLDVGLIPSGIKKEEAQKSLEEGVAWVDFEKNTGYKQSRLFRSVSNTRTTTNNELRGDLIIRCKEYRKVLKVVGRKTVWNKERKEKRVRDFE